MQYSAQQLSEDEFKKFVEKIVAKVRVQAGDLIDSQPDLHKIPKPILALLSTVGEEMNASLMVRAPNESIWEILDLLGAFGW